MAKKRQVAADESVIIENGKRRYLKRGQTDPHLVDFESEEKSKQKHKSNEKSKQEDKLHPTDEKTDRSEKSATENEVEEATSNPNDHKARKENKE